MNDGCCLRCRGWFVAFSDGSIYSRDEWNLHDQVDIIPMQPDAVAAFAAAGYEPYGALCGKDWSWSTHWMGRETQLPWARVRRIDSVERCPLEVAR